MANIAPTFEISFIPPDIQAPRIKELYPIPNAVDVSTKSNVIAYLVDTESGIDINSVVVTVDKKDYRITTHDVLDLQYTGVASEAVITIFNNNVLQVYLDNVQNISITFSDVNYSTVKKVSDYLNSLPDYTCSVSDTRYAQYASRFLLEVSNVDIKTSETALKLLLPEENTNFSFMEREDGYIVFANPVYEFDSKVAVNVSINAADNDGNKMAAFNYIFIPNSLATLSISKRNYLNQQSLVYIKDIQEYIASNYTRSKSTEFYGHHKSIGLELARLQEEFDHIHEDASFETVRPEYLYEKFGYLMEIEPTKSLAHQEYRNQLLSMRDIYFVGSLVSSLEKGIAIFTDQQVVIFEMWKIRPDDISLQHIIKIEILIGTGRLLNIDLIAINNNLATMFNQVKPAHIYLIQGFVWYDNYVRPEDVLADLILDGRVDGWSSDVVAPSIKDDEERYEIVNHLAETFSNNENLLILNDTNNVELISGKSETYDLSNGVFIVGVPKDGAQLGVSINGGSTNWVTFSNTIEFVVDPLTITTYPLTGDKYSNNGSVFIFYYVSTTLFKAYRFSGTNNPTPSGTITKVTGSGDTTIVFSDSVGSDFVDITAATAAEVAFVLNRTWNVTHHLGVHVVENAGNVIIYSSQTIQIIDGIAQPNLELQFPTSQFLVEHKFDFIVSGTVVYPLIGDQYSNNGSTFIIDQIEIDRIRARRIVGTNDPELEGDLIRVTGSGDVTITFSSVSSSSISVLNDRNYVISPAESFRIFEDQYWFDSIVNTLTDSYAGPTEYLSWIIDFVTPFTDTTLASLDIVSEEISFGTHILPLTENFRDARVLITNDISRDLNDTDVDIAPVGSRIKDFYTWSLVFLDFQDAWTAGADPDYQDTWSSGSEYQDTWA